MSSGAVSCTMLWEQGDLSLISEWGWRCYLRPLKTGFMQRYGVLDLPARPLKKNHRGRPIFYGVRGFLSRLICRNFLPSFYRTLVTIVLTYVAFFLPNWDQRIYSKSWQGTFLKWVPKTQIHTQKLLIVKEDRTNVSLPHSKVAIAGQHLVRPVAVKHVTAAKSG